MALCSWVRVLATASLIAGCGDASGGTGGSGDSDSASEGGTSTSGVGPGTDGTGGEDDGGTTGEPDACATDVTPGGEVVSTERGPVAGRHGDVFSFLGIPYAAPPVGDLRFRPPEQPTCWTQTRAAVDFAPDCIQVDDGNVIGDEDCLYLNVWTPDPHDGGARPVMVFLHGGGNAAGGPSNPVYDGSILAAQRDVVVVTPAYRLGALGFATHPALATQSVDGVSGNYGIQDQIHALAWVRDNIARFGGDPGRVTVLGESAGAVDTCAVVGSPLAAGLLHGAIVQSGTCSFRSVERLEQDASTAFAVNAGCDSQPDPAACLRAMSAEAIVTTEPTGEPSVSALGQVWGPHVDGHVLPTQTIDAMEAGTHNRVPFIVGANAEETARDVGELTQAQYEDLVNLQFGPVLGGLVLARYPVSDYDDPRAAFVALTSDVKFVCGARQAARAAATGQDDPVYRYHFAYDGYTTGPATEPAAFHGLELVYLFGTFDAIDLGPVAYEPNADDLAMADTIAGSWTRFAATGDPGEKGVPWPAYATATDPHALLDVPTVAGEGVRTAQCDFWEALTPM